MPRYGDQSPLPEPKQMCEDGVLTHQGSEGLVPPDPHQISEDCVLQLPIDHHEKNDDWGRANLQSEPSKMHGPDHTPGHTIPPLLLESDVLDPPLMEQGALSEHNQLSRDGVPLEPKQKPSNGVLPLLSETHQISGYEIQSLEPAQMLRDDVLPLLSEALKVSGVISLPPEPEQMPRDEVLSLQFETHHASVNAIRSPEPTQMPKHGVLPLKSENHQVSGNGVSSLPDEPAQMPRDEVPPLLAETHQVPKEIEHNEPQQIPLQPKPEQMDEDRVQSLLPKPNMKVHAVVLPFPSEPYQMPDHLQLPCMTHTEPSLTRVVTLPVLPETNQKDDDDVVLPCPSEPTQVPAPYQLQHMNQTQPSLSEDVPLPLIPEFNQMSSDDALSRQVTRHDILPETPEMTGYQIPPPPPPPEPPHMLINEAVTLKPEHQVGQDHEIQPFLPLQTPSTSSAFVATDGEGAGFEMQPLQTLSTPREIKIKIQVIVFLNMFHASSIYTYHTAFCPLFHFRFLFLIH